MRDRSSARSERRAHKPRCVGSNPAGPTRQLRALPMVQPLGGWRTKPKLALAHVLADARCRERSMRDGIKTPRLQARSSTQLPGLIPGWALQASGTRLGARPVTDVPKRSTNHDAVWPTADYRLRAWDLRPVVQFGQAPVFPFVHVAQLGRAQSQIVPMET